MADGPLFQDWLTELGKVAAFERLSYPILYMVDKRYVFTLCYLWPVLGGAVTEMRMEVVWVKYRDLFTGRLPQLHIGQ